jgi:Ca2+-binding EF-hand superfamily protein
MMNRTLLAAFGAASFLAVAGVAFAQGGPGAMLLAADANHDGKVTKAEMQAYREATFVKLDVNKDGFLTPDELGARAQMAMRNDKNGDGKLDKAEFTDVTRMFGFLDKNGDGVIDQSEISAMAAMRPGG